MARNKKIIEQILRGSADAAIRFDDLRKVLLDNDFTETVRGSHHVFRRTGYSQLINLQRDGKHGKPYQVRQVRNAIVELGLSEDDNA